MTAAVSVGFEHRALSTAFSAAAAAHASFACSGEKLQPLANEFPALVIVFAGEFVVATEKRATHAAIDAVDNLNFLIRQNIPPIRPRHGKIDTR
jgi:hypothetical protein